MNIRNSCTTALLTCSVFLAGCSTDKPQTTDFDRGALLTFYADALIVPGYARYAQTCRDLQTAWMTFSSSPDPSSLADLQETMVRAWTAWQEVAPLDFGPALDRGLSGFSNTFPTDTITIALLMNTGSWDLSQADNLDAQGFPALDYLLASGSDGELIAAYDSSPGAAARKAFTEALISRLVQLSESVQADWESQYSQDFAAADGVDIGSSLGKLINAFNRYLERDLRDGKIGIPLGVRTLGIPQPDKVEGLYSGESVALLLSGVNAYRIWLLGTQIGTGEGIGLDDYLDAVDARYGQVKLSSEIRDALADAEAAISGGITVPLDEAVLVQTESVEEAYTALQRLLVLTKVDLSSSLGILITYQDNDGD